jgi:hypothetical protein
VQTFVRMAVERAGSDAGHCVVSGGIEEVLCRLLLF